MLRLTTPLLLAATCLLVNAGHSTETVITCEGNHVHRLSCAETGVISVQTVLYGREDSVTCSEGKTPQETSNTACSLADSAEIVKKRCDGKKVCELSTKVFEASNPCPGTYKYLQTNYNCFPAIHQVICEHSLTYLQCAEGQVLSIYGADYGRHDKTTCSYTRPEQQIQDTDCSVRASDVVDSCNGKNRCIIKASNSVFGDPCVGTYKYLEVAYICEYPVNTKEESTL